MASESSFFIHITLNPYHIMKEKEIWQPVPGYEGYEASNLGDIRSLNYGRTGKVRVLKPGICGGYLSVMLYKNREGKRFYVHRLVWVSFRAPIPKGLQINHINENIFDNRLSNLEVVTPKQNLNHGTRNERAAKARLGKKHSEEAKAKMSLARKGKPTWNKGKKLSEEYRAKLSAAHKGKKFTEEHKANMRAAHKARREKSLGINEHLIE